MDDVSVVCARCSIRFDITADVVEGWKENGSLCPACFVTKAEWDVPTEAAPSEEATPEPEPELIGSARDLRELTYSCSHCGEKFKLAVDAEPWTDHDGLVICTDCCATLDDWYVAPELAQEPAPLPDSGERAEFITGAVRDRASGKGRFDLLSPIALRRLAQHYEAGAVKYSDRNWEKGIPLYTFIDSARRHINDFMHDMITGTKPAEDHLSAGIWNLMAYIHTEEMIKRGLLPDDLDNMPHRKE